MILNVRLMSFYEGHSSSSLCVNGITYVYIDTVFAFDGYFFYAHLYCLVGCLSMIVWSHAVLDVMHACLLNFRICAWISAFEHVPHGKAL